LKHERRIDGLHVQVYLSENGDELDVGNLVATMPRFREEWLSMLTAITRDTIARMMRDDCATSCDQAVLIELFPCEVVDLAGMAQINTEPERSLFTMPTIVWRSETPIGGENGK